MAIKDVESKCWILALFVRDDGERFLLGDGSYEFTEKQLHFAANTMANDVVEVQGNDGYLLAGQVRRPSTQTFDGYVGDSSTSKAVVEERRRAFFAFFRKNFFYKVIYIFPDGSAIQRKRGFLVDAPEVKEIRQIYPEYHVALNFEDINYYYYDEDADGQEIYGKSATINLNSVAQSGGLIWLLPSEMTLAGEGTSFTLSGTVNGTALTSAELKGDTYQQTYSGKNLLDSLSFTAAYINAAGTVISDSGSNNALFDYIDVNPNTDYTASYNGSGTVQIQFAFFDSAKTIISRDINYDYLKARKITTPANCAYLRVWMYKESVWAQDIVNESKLQLEQGSTATSYEPYTGGIPAPNPDYPQEVQTATGRQVVTISDGTESQEYEVNLGKNLFDEVTANMLVARLNSEGDIATGITNRLCTQGYIPVSPNTTYTLNATPENTSKFLDAYMCGYTEEGSTTAIGNYPSNAWYRLPITFTTGVNCNFIRISYRYSDDSTISVTSAQDQQLEKGSTASSYAPYFEPIELCKIGDYQDRIYKNGSDWYLHKEIGKQILDGSENFTKSGSTSGDIFSYTLQNGDRNGTTEVISNYFLYNSANVIPSSRKYNDIIYFVFSTYGTTDIAGFKVWLSTHNTVVYYILATPTDTQITNTALIAQLNALAAVTTYNGSTSFTVDGNGNLAAVLAVEVEAVGGGGVEWDENGAVWEEGKPSYSIISVDSIDNVYPVLTITGRTVNPVLTDVTTGTIFQYNGTITDSQVLRVDMMSKTATLNGVSVIGNVTGDWLYLAPGNNRVTYTADNADAPNATVEWQEIVG